VERKMRVGRVPTGRYSEWVCVRVQGTGLQVVSLPLSLPPPAPKTDATSGKLGDTETPLLLVGRCMNDWVPGKSTIPRVDGVRKSRWRTREEAVLHLTCVS
jgi:hypothetical protein